MAPPYAVSDSDAESELSQPPMPSDEALEKALRDTVANIYKSGKMEELTVKRVRLAAERSLSLDEGFYKGSDTWKAKSDQIIKDEVDVQDKATQESEPETKKNILSPSPSPKIAKAAKRTKSVNTSAARKRRKTASPEPQNEESELSGLTSESEGEDTTQKPVQRRSKTKKEQKLQTKIDNEYVSNGSDAAEEEPVKETTETVGSESEMSVVLDEEPKPPHKRRKSSEAASQKGKKKNAPGKPKDGTADPNEAEIKRLQGWLVKCGIRKVWSRELAPYDTSRAKIKHLKDMLKDIGMEGRYSLEKAREIKEERELQADLEMIKEGEKQWGRGSVEEESDNNQPRRRLNRGRQTLAFLDSEGEETD